MAQTISPFLDAAASLASLKKTETVLPIAGYTAHVDSLYVGDDISLRTSVTSPVGFDRELSSLLCKHTQIVTETETKKLDLQNFSSHISNIDRSSLLWALYKSTYDILASQREITCEVKECSYKYKIDILLDDLIHEDTFCFWDEVDVENNIIPFYQFRYPISIDYQGYKCEFLSRLPTISDNNQLLSLLSIDDLQYNLEATGSLFSRAQSIALLIEAIQVIMPNSPQPVQSNNIQEILIALQKYIPYQISEDFFESYNVRFDKYIPKFYKQLVCPKCGKQSKYDVDLEVEFFRRVLFGRGESE